MSTPTKHTNGGYSGFSDEAHPDLFNINAMPEQPKELKEGQLPPEKIKQFFEKV